MSNTLQPTATTPRLEAHPGPKAQLNPSWVTTVMALKKDLASLAESRKTNIRAKNEKGS